MIQTRAFSDAIIYYFSTGPSEPVEDVSVTVESATTVKVSWLLPDPQTWNGLILNYTIVYELMGPVKGAVATRSTGEIYSITLPSPGQPLLNSPDPRIVTQPLHREILTIDRLQEYHVYSFAIYMANKAGRSTLTTPIVQELPGASRC